MPDNDSVTWEVGKQFHTTQPNQAGPPTSGVNVPVVLSTGESFDLFVPDDVYRDPETVRQAIVEAVNRHVAVANLTGTV